MISLKLCIKYKLLGSISLLIGTILSINQLSKEKGFLRNLCLALIVLSLCLVQLYGKILFKKYLIKGNEENESENTPLNQKKYPLLNEFNTKIKEFNAELEALEKDDDPQSIHFKCELKKNIGTISLKIKSFINIS